MRFHRGRAAGLVAVLAFCRFGAAAQSELDGVWMHRRMQNPQTGQQLDMSTQIDPGRNLTLGILCNAEKQLKLVLVPKPADGADAVAYRIDGGPWISQSWRGEDKRLVLDGEEGRRVFGTMLLASNGIEIRIGAERPARFLAAGLIESAAKTTARCLSPS